MTRLFPEFAQKSHTLRAHPSLRYGDAMPDVILTLGPAPDQSSPPHSGFPQPGPRRSELPQTGFRQAQPPQPQFPPAQYPQTPPAPAQVPQPQSPQSAADARPAQARTGRAPVRERRTLTRADWIGTALDAMARDGLRAVAVEPLAERLGATKGSFYWHFRDRNALIEAAAADWEHTGTDLPLAQLGAIVDPRERYAATLRWLTGSERNTRILLVMLWHADHPAIGPVVERVLTKRMSFSLRMRQDAGAGQQDAQWAGIHAYSAWLGLQLLRRAAPGLIPQEDATAAFFQYAASLSARLLIEPADAER